MRELVTINDARLFRTTRAFLDFACLRDLADLPPLESDEEENSDVLTGHSTATMALTAAVGD